MYASLIKILNYVIVKIVWLQLRKLLIKCEREINKTKVEETKLEKVQLQTVTSAGQCRHKAVGESH